MKTKTVEESRVIHTRLIMPGDTNNHNTLYGGNLMQVIDSVAAISYQKHCRASGVTASMDRLNFIAPLPQSHALTIEAMVSGVGQSSVEVFVKVFGESLREEKEYLAATAFLTFVVLDEDRIPLPQIVATTEIDQFILDGYEERRQARLRQRELDLKFQDQVRLSASNPS